MTWKMAFWLTSIFFALTYLALALGKVPGLRIDRAGIALVGATLMLVTGMLSFDEAVSPASIDYKTLCLLFAVMIVVAFLRLSGVLAWTAHAALGKAKGAWGLLAATILLSGALSAFLINDVVCLALAPLLIQVARYMKVDPVPHLVALATAANIGSVATITGNPQDIYIGSHSGIPYLHFVARMLPVAVAGLLLNVAVAGIVFRKRLHALPGAGDGDATSMPETPLDRSAGPAPILLQVKSVAVALVVVILFFAGLPLELVALGGASLLVLGRVKPERVYREIDWGLIVMFVGLFVVTHAVRMRVVGELNLQGWHLLLDHPTSILSLASAALSNLVSNVPAVLLLEPVVKAMPSAQQETAWLSLAMSSTFAGNLTVLGSVANLIVLEIARRQRVRVTFWEYCSVGVPLTILTLLTGMVWLELSS